jgi:phospholipid transport system transporter-binding protein
MKFEKHNNTLKIEGKLNRFTLDSQSLKNVPSFDENLVIDLSKASSIDTAGLAFVITLLSYYQKKNLDVVIDSASEQLIALARVSNVLGLLPISK